ncbi:hypothetical protein GQ600_12798 [Phytophthora cactorum]|nr:hypothetical protein GQ600_12798 [Phytophthora cactorum]
MSEKRGAASEAVRDDGGPRGRSAFAAGKRIHNYMYATLVIEQDDDGDEDFIYDEDFARREEREEEEAEKLPSDLVESPNAGGGAGRAIAYHQQGVDEEVATTLATSEHVPRKRTSKHLEELESMGNQYTKSAGTTSTRLFESTSGKNNLKFRIRSSETTNVSTGMHELLFNGSNNLANHEPSQAPFPSEFEWTHKIFRCTHGVTQGSRRRAIANQEPPCKARLTAAVAPVARNTHAILIRNENHTHSHPNIGTQASAYLTTKTLPLDEQDRECKIPYFLAVRMRMSKALLTILYVWSGKDVRVVLLT